MKTAIQVYQLSKQFRHRRAERPTTWQEAILHGLRNLRASQPFYALQHVDLQVPSGDMLGIIGANGAGKSTLLRLIGGIGKPDEGSIHTLGRVHAIFDLGAGFHPDLTGRENVFVAGVIAGLTRREVGQRFDAIVDFAELAEFIDSPLRTYSAGMTMRLAFAIAIHTEPDILLIDEVLAVGDRAFQSKCLERIQRFKREGCAIVLVSHDLSTVQTMCDEVLWLRRGRVAAHGPADAVVQQYITRTDTLTKMKTPEQGSAAAPHTAPVPELHQNRFGSQEMVITSVALLDGSGKPADEIQCGDPLSIRIEYDPRQNRAAPIAGVTIASQDEFICYETHSAPLDFTPLAANGAKPSVTLQLDRLDLRPGRYYFDVGLYEKNWEYAYDYHWHTYALSIRSDETVDKGILQPPHRWVR